MKEKAGQHFIADLLSQTCCGSDGGREDALEAYGMERPRHLSSGAHARRGRAPGSARPPPAVPDHNSLRPRLSPLNTAWVRSLASSFERMLLTWLLIASSVAERCAAISLLEFPWAMRRSTRTSTGDS